MCVRQCCNLAFRHNTVEIIAFLFQSSCVLRPVVKVQLAICVLRKILNLHLPAVSLIQRYGLNELVRSIPPVSDLLFQVDFDLGRALTILIISVIPYLSDDYPDYLRGIGVGYVVAAYTCCIICYCILGDRIIDHFSIRILRQIFPFPAPGVRCRDSLYFIGQLCAVCKQVNLNLPWTLAILIVRIVPGLASADVDQFFIYNYEALFSKAFYFHCKFVSADRHLSVRFANFLHTVSNFIAVTIRDWEVFPCVTPAVFCIQSRRITVLCFGSILHFTKQLNLYTCICWDIVFLYPLFSYHTARGFFFIFENNRIAAGKFIQCYIVCVSFSF